MPLPLRLAPTVLALIATPLVAQGSPSVTTEVRASVGFVQASGNTAVSTSSFSAGITQQRGRLGLGQTLSFDWGEQDGRVNTNRLRGALRADYSLGKHFSAIAEVIYDRDVFAGIKRRFAEDVGLEWRVVPASKDTLRIQTAFAVTQQVAMDGTTNDFPSGRAFVAYRHHFAPKTYFVQEAEFLPNFKNPDDFRVSAKSFIVAPVSRMVSLKVTYSIRFDNLPEPTFGSTDRLLTTGIEFVF